MRYGLMPRLMWAEFAPGFKAALPMITTDDAERTMRAAKALPKHTGKRERI